MPELLPNQRIFDVLQEIHSGRYRIPNIQRGYEWDEDRVTKLLDSVMSGYPFGAILVWRPVSTVATDIPTRRFVQHFDSTKDYLSEPPATDDVDVYLVLDGQQRLQSLYLSFFGSYNGRRMFFQIDHIPTDVGDDTDFRFEFLSVQDAKTRPEMVHVSEVLKLDAETKYEFARGKAMELAGPGGDQEPNARREIAIAKNIDRFIERFNIRAGLLFQEIEKKHDYDHVLEVFERVNSGGMVLDKSDLLFSTLKLKLQQMEQAFLETITFLNHGDRYDFNTDFLIKACLVIFDQRAKYEVAKLKNDQFVKQVDLRFKDVNHCLRHLSVWLDEAARIKCSRFLRSRLALIPILDWMMLSDNHDKPDGENARAMVEYLHMAFFRRLFRSPDVVLDQLHTLLQGAVKIDHAKFPIREIRAMAVARQRTPWQLEPHSFEDDADLMINIVDGGVLQIDPTDSTQHVKDLKLEVDHIFPRTPLSRMGLGDVVNQIGNYRLVVLPVNRRKSGKLPNNTTAFFGRNQKPIETLFASCVERHTMNGTVDRAAFLAFRNARSELIANTVQDFLGVRLAANT
jgi:uncharacterized protein DUF262